MNSEKDQRGKNKIKTWKCVQNPMFTKSCGAQGVASDVISDVTTCKLGE